MYRIVYMVSEIDWKTFNSCFHREIEYSYKTNISYTNNITSISFYLYANPIAKEDRDIKGIECRDQ